MKETLGGLGGCMWLAGRVVAAVPQVEVVHHQDLNKRILIALIMASIILGRLMLFLSCFWIYRWRKFRNFNGKNQKKIISSSPHMVKFNSLRMGKKKASVAIFEYQLWFINQVSWLSKIQHQNIVKILSHCINGKTRLLVYEMMQNESLETQSSRVWHLTLRIVVNQCNPSIIHRNLTLSNILLDSKSSAKGISTHKHDNLELSKTSCYVASLSSLNGKQLIVISKTRAIMKNPSHFNGVVVMDLGCGTCIGEIACSSLSFKISLTFINYYSNLVTYIVYSHIQI
ncbi:hypothetical protein UlMin_043295 [Ulmus minor]